MGDKTRTEIEAAGVRRVGGRFRTRAEVQDLLDPRASGASDERLMKRTRRPRSGRTPRRRLKRG